MHNEIIAQNGGLRRESIGLSHADFFTPRHEGTKRFSFLSGKLPSSAEATLIQGVMGREPVLL